MMTLAGLFLHISIVPYLAIGAARPDIMSLVVILYGLFLGPAAGWQAGCMAGVMKDLFSTAPFGVGLVSGSLTGLCAGLLGARFFGESRAVRFLLIFLLTAFSSVSSQYILASVSRSAWPALVECMRGSTLLSAVYTTVVSIPIFFKFLTMYGLHRSDGYL